MKRIILAALILIIAGSAAFAQQRARTTQTTDQIRQEAQQLLTSSRSNNSEYEADLVELRDRNSGNNASSIFYRLRTEIANMENMINQERTNIEARLDRGTRVSSEVLTRFERMIHQHLVKTGELEEFLSSL